MAAPAQHQAMLAALKARKVQAILFTNGVNGGDSPEGRAIFRAWSEAIVKAFSITPDPAGADTAIRAINGFFEEVIDARKAHPGDDLVSLLVRSGGEGEDPLSLDELLVRSETHLGTVDEVAASLAEDAVAAGATEVSIQAHSVDPDPSVTDRSLELFAREVAPALGWRVSTAAQEARNAA